MSLGKACRNGCQTSCGCDSPEHRKSWNILGIHLDFADFVSYEDAKIVAENVRKHYPEVGKNETT